MKFRFFDSNKQVVAAVRKIAQQLVDDNGILLVHYLSPNYRMG